MLFWLVTVLPVLMVTPFSVLLPLFMTPPLLVVRVPPVIVLPFRFRPWLTVALTIGEDAGRRYW